MSDHDLDLPFEEVPGGPIAAPMSHDSVVCGGLVIRAAAVDTPAGRLPALIFDFFRVDGATVVPLVLISDDPEPLRKLVPLVDQSVAAAIAGAGS